MRPANWLIVLVGISVFASVVVPRYMPAPLRPDLFVVLTVFIAMRARAEEAVAFCWFTGLASDLLSSGPVGGGALTHMAVALVILKLRSLIDVRMALTQVVFGLIAGLLAGAAHFGGAVLAGGNVSASGGVLLGSSLATGLIIPLSVVGLKRASVTLGP